MVKGELYYKFYTLKKAEFFNKSKITGCCSNFSPLIKIFTNFVKLKLENFVTINFKIYFPVNMSV